MPIIVHPHPQPPQPSRRNRQKKSVDKEIHMEYVFGLIFIQTATVNRPLFISIYLSIFGRENHYGNY